MKTITLKLTMEEAELLTTLVTDQLFRKEFIDTKMPGYKAKAEEITRGKALISRLRVLRDPTVETGPKGFNNHQPKVSIPTLTP